MYKIVFSSDDLPPGLDDVARFSAWRDFFANVNGPLEVSRLPDRPFNQRMECARFDSIRVMRLRGTTDRIWWTSPSGAARRSPDFYLCLNRDLMPMSLAQMGREAEFHAETAVLAAAPSLMPSARRAAMISPSSSFRRPGCASSSPGSRISSQGPWAAPRCNICGDISMF